MKIVQQHNTLLRLTQIQAVFMRTTRPQFIHTQKEKKSTFAKIAKVFCYQSDVL